MYRIHLHNSYSHDPFHFTWIHFLVKPPKNAFFSPKNLNPFPDFAEISQCCGVLHDSKTVFPDFGYLFPFGFSGHLSDSTLRFMVKFSKKFHLQPNGKRYPKSGKTVFLSCITPQHCKISAKSEQGLRIFEGKMRFLGVLPKKWILVKWVELWLYELCICVLDILDYILKPKDYLYGQRLSHNQRGFFKVWINTLRESYP